MIAARDKTLARAFGLIAITIVFLYYLSIYIGEEYFHVRHIQSILSQFLILTINIITGVYCVRFSFRSKKAWKLFFLLYGATNLFSSTITVLYYSFNFNFLLTTSLLNLFNKNSDFTLLIYTITIISRLIAWGCIATQLLTYLRQRLSYYWPFVPSVLSILVVVALILLSYLGRTQQTGYTTWMIIRPCVLLLEFSLLIFCLPMIKNSAMIIFASGNLLSIMGYVLISDVITSGSLFGGPYFSIVYPAYLLSLLAEFLMLLGIILLSRSPVKNSKSMFYFLDNSRPQILYWCNSVALIFFLALALHTLATKEWFNFLKVAFNANITLIIPFVGTMSFLSTYFVRYFNRDFASIYQQVDHAKHLKAGEKIKQQRIVFGEFRRISHFLTKKFNAISDKKATQDHIMQVATQAAHDIRTPVTVLSTLMESFQDKLTNEERKIYHRSFEDIKAIAHQILMLQERSSLSSNPLSPLSKTSEYISIIMREAFPSEDQIGQHAELIIKPSVEFILASLNAITFKKALQQLFLFTAKTQMGITEKFWQCKLATNELTVILNTASDFWVAKFQESKANVQAIARLFKQTDVNLRLETDENRNLVIRLHFKPLSSLPAWWTDHINLRADTSIILLDDEAFYHQQWQSLFKPLQENYPKLRLTSCYTLDEFEKAISSYPQNRFILMDYNIQGEANNGLEIIEEYQCADDALLVTNHYHNTAVQAVCEQLEVKMLPKPLIDSIKIDIS